MEKKTGFSHLEGLEIIQSMINRAKDRFSENGHLYLLWGWVVFLCSIAEFVLLHMVGYEHHYAVWALCWVAVVYQVIYLSKKKKRERVKTYTDDIVGFVWLAFVVSMFLMGFLFGRIMGEAYYKIFAPGFLVLYGIPTFLSGIILRFRPLIIGGIACWVLSVVASFITSAYQLLFLSMAVLVAWIIPGYMLRAKYKRVNN
jgi:hypothetical protein